MDEQFEGKSKAYIQGYNCALGVEKGTVVVPEYDSSAQEKSDVLNPYSAPNTNWHEWRSGFNRGRVDTGFSKAYDEGSKARQHGFIYKDNPYKTDPDRTQWIRGFRETPLTDESAQILKERLASNKK